MCRGVILVPSGSVINIDSFPADWVLCVETEELSSAPRVGYVLV